MCMQFKMIHVHTILQQRIINNIIIFIIYDRTVKLSISVHEHIGTNKYTSSYIAGHCPEYIYSTLKTTYYEQAAVPHDMQFSSRQE